MTREELKAALRTAADDYKRATDEILAAYVGPDDTNAHGMHGRCGDQMPSFLSGPPVCCTLRAGHDGWHENGNAGWSL